MKAYPVKIDEALFHQEAEEGFIELLPKLPLHPGSKRHLFNELMPALATIAAVYQVLKKHGYTVEQIGRLQYEGYLQLFNKIPKPVRSIARRFMVSSLFPKLMHPSLEKMAASGREDTFFLEYGFQRKPRRTTTMCCTQCAMITFMEKNDLHELKRICNVFDFAQAESFGLGLQQPSCIGQGAATCRYIFTTDSKDTILAQNLIEILNASMEV